MSEMQDKRKTLLRNQVQVFHCLYPQAAVGDPNPASSPILPILNPQATFTAKPNSQSTGSSQRCGLQLAIQHKKRVSKHTIITITFHSVTWSPMMQDVKRFEPTQETGRD
jgi:hypothetical protein